MNSVAGGGSFLSFPALHLRRRAADLGQRDEQRGDVGRHHRKRARLPRRSCASIARSLLPVLAVSVVGSLIGAVLLARNAVDALRALDSVAAALRDARSSRRARCSCARSGVRRATRGGSSSRSSCVAIYGGYFGAGMGIVMLAILAFSGFPSFNATQRRQERALGCDQRRRADPVRRSRASIDWRFALPMAVVALAGGYVGARFFRRLPAAYARLVVITIGVVMTVVFFRR